MALRKPADTATNASFEDMDEAEGTQVQHSEAAADSAQADAVVTEKPEVVSNTLKDVVDDKTFDVAEVAAEVVETKTTAVAVAKTSALVKTTAKAVALVNVVSDVKDAFHVDFDSLPRIIAEQGSMVMKEGAEELGTWIKLKMLSFQDSWVCSPNDNKASKELVKFSEDGKVDREGNCLFEHLRFLKEEGHAKAKISHRLVVVGELLATGNGAGPIEDLVQIDLSETGRKSFNTYTLQASYKVAKGKFSAEDSTILRMTAEKARSSGGDVYTKVVVAVAAELAATAAQ